MERETTKEVSQGREGNTKDKLEKMRLTTEG